MSTKRNKHESENEDDPEPFESSGDEWDAQEAKNGRRKSSRVVKKPKRVAEESDDEVEFSDEDFVEEPKSKKPGAKGSKAAAKKQPVKNNEEEEENSSEGEFSEEEQPKKKKPAPKRAAKTLAKPTPKKKATNESEEAEESSEEEEDSDNEDSSGSDKSKTRQPLPKTIYSEDFATGSFVILKKDAKGGAEKRPVIWRIDGKALLQKFEPFVEDDKIQHKNTSIYTGWSPLDQELYSPLIVDVKSHVKNNLVVEVHWDELSTIEADSD